MLATIPFFETSPIVLIKDIIEIHVFGILVGIGVVLGTWLAQKRATEKNLSPVVVGDLGLWLVITGFIMAHQVSLFAYYPDRVFGPDGSWFEVLKISSGISSFGGFLGAALGMLWFFNVERIVLIPKMLEFRGGKGRPVLKYLDVMAYGFTVGWFFGRMGCFSAHDHVGLASASALAVNFPDGWRDSVPAIAGYGAPGFTPRFDLGFLEMWYPAVLYLFFRFVADRQTGLRPGWYAAVFILFYAPVRFYLDTLRATDIGGADKRYFAELLSPGFTPGQFGAVAVLIVGLVIWVLGGIRAKDPAYMAQFEPDDPTDALKG
jgi:phosphatidylglycerol:prolipoprotein diacylglycerol transferase